MSDDEAVDLSFMGRVLGAMNGVADEVRAEMGAVEIILGALIVALDRSGALPSAEALSAIDVAAGAIEDGPRREPIQRALVHLATRLRARLVPPRRPH